MNEEIDRYIVDSLRGIFLKEFSNMSGCMAVFILSNKTDDPSDTLNKILDFWAKSKNPVLEEVISKTLEVRASPEKFSEYEQEVFGSIDPEDYQIQFQKAVAYMKKDVKDLFEQFQENFK